MSESDTVHVRQTIPNVFIIISCSMGKINHVFRKIIVGNELIVHPVAPGSIMRIPELHGKPESLAI